MIYNNQNTIIKILLIEADPVDANLIEEMFSRMQRDSFNLEWAGNLRTGLECMSKEKPGLILLDLSLPDNQGLDALMRVREESQDTPVLILTGLEDDKLGIEAVRAGAQDFLSKGKITGSGLERCIRYTIERKNVEMQFRKSEKRFKKLIDQNADGIILVNREGVVVFANPAMQSFTGINPSELVGATFGFPILAGETAELDFYHPQKGPIIAEMHVVELEWEDDMVYLASLRDITRRKHAEIDLKNSQAMQIETEKIGALGTLVAGIAHELNNPMMGLLNYSQYCLKHVPKNNKAFPVLEDAVRETKRCIDIVLNLLTFSRMEKIGDEKFERINCLIIIDRVINLLKYRIEKENISIKRSVEGTFPEILAKSSNLQQVFLNLIGNALDALSGLESKIIQIQAFKEINTIRIDISDNGCGIKKEHLQTIFDPFFTTKPPGKGTGLGLSVCRNIVEAHNGKITCESTPGKGTTFSVRLPILIETSSEGRQPGLPEIGIQKIYLDGRTL